jgi:hypothetical protein
MKQKKGGKFSMPERGKNSLPLDNHLTFEVLARSESFFNLAKPVL